MREEECRVESLNEWLDMQIEHTIKVINLQPLTDTGKSTAEHFKGRLSGLLEAKHKLNGGKSKPIFHPES